MSNYNQGLTDVNKANFYDDGNIKRLSITIDLGIFFKLNRCRT
jgi:hypothetical protein